MTIISYKVRHTWRVVESIGQILLLITINDYEGQKVNYLYFTIVLRYISSLIIFLYHTIGGCYIGNYCVCTFRFFLLANSLIFCLISMVFSSLLKKRAKMFWNSNDLLFPLFLSSTVPCSIIESNWFPISFRKYI